MLTARDGWLHAWGRHRTDKFRIKIWTYDEELKQDVVVYDNQIDLEHRGHHVGGHGHRRRQHRGSYVRQVSTLYQSGSQDGQGERECNRDGSDELRFHGDVVRQVTRRTIG